MPPRLVASSRAWRRSWDALYLGFKLPLERRQRFKCVACVVRSRGRIFGKLGSAEKCSGARCERHAPQGYGAALISSANSVIGMGRASLV
jgi:hypothetical protein